MKKIIVITVFSLIASVGLSQVRKDTTKAKAPTTQYEYFVKVNPQVYQQLLNIIHQYRDVVIYNPILKDEEKVNLQVSIDKALQELSKVKADSIKTH